MRDRQLHGTLLAFAEEAAWTLAAETAAGAELPFDVVEERTGGAWSAGPTLYCYRPDTSGFIAERERTLAGLENWPAAVAALTSCAGLDAYLRSRGHTRIPASAREQAEATLRAFLGALFEDLSEFVISEERLARVYAELEERVVGGVTGVEVIVPLFGLAVESDEVVLSPGLSLAKPDTLERVPEAAAWDGAEPTVLAVVTGDEADAAALAPARIRRLVTALRLYDPANVAMGPTAWIRTAGGAWQAAPTGAGGLACGCLEVPAAQEDELRGFCNLVWRKMPRGGALAWALARFDMGCERPAIHRLTDHLLALRALLGAHGEAGCAEGVGGDGVGLLADRVATLCSAAEHHVAVAERVAHAVSLERALVAGHGTAGGEAEAIAADLAGHLRAILRDVLCGHLDTDVRRLADELLDAAGA